MKGGNFKSARGRLLEQIEKPRQIYGPVHLKHLPLGQRKVRPQSLDNFGVGALLDFQAHGRSLPAQVELRVHGIQNAARFLLAQIQVAVARHAKGRGGQDFVTVIQAMRIRVHDVVQEREFDCPLRRGQAQEPGKRARHGDHAQKDLGRFFPALQMKRDTKRFIQDTRKRMSRVDRYRGQYRLDLLRIKFLDKFLRLRVKFINLSHANIFRSEPRNEVLPPAGVLIFYELLQLIGQFRKQFAGREPVGPDLPALLLRLLQEPGHADFHKLIEVAGRNRQKFHAFEQRIAQVACFLEHAAVKLQPRKVAIQKVTRVLKRGTAHLHFP